MISHQNTTIETLTSEIENMKKRLKETCAENADFLDDLFDKIHMHIGELNDTFQRLDSERQDALRRQKRAEEEKDQGAKEALKKHVEKLGERRILSMLDELVNTGVSAANGPTPKTIQDGLQKWIKDITRNYFDADLKPVVLSPEITVQRDEVSNLYVFEPHNPFSDEFPRARCRVRSSGWRAGSIIIEKSRLEVLHPLPDESEVHILRGTLQDRQRTWGKGLKKPDRDKLLAVLDAIMVGDTFEQAAKRIYKRNAVSQLRTHMKKWNDHDILSEIQMFILTDSISDFVGHGWDRFMVEAKE